MFFSFSITTRSTDTTAVLSYPLPSPPPSRPPFSPLYNFLFSSLAAESKFYLGV